MTAPVVALPSLEPAADLEAERTILASALDGQLAPVLESGLRPEHFYSEAHRRIYEAIVALDAEGQGPTLHGVRAWLDGRGRLHQIGGSEYLADVSFSPTAIGATLGQLLEAVSKLARARTAIATLSGAAAQLRAEPRRLDAVLSSTRETVEALSSDTGDGGLANVTFEELTNPRPEPNWLIKDLGIAPGAPTLIAGYGYSGKTLAAQEIALAVICGGLAFGRFQCGQGKVLHIDQEQGKDTTIQRYQRMCAAHGIAIADVAPWLEIASFPQPAIQIDSPESLTRLTRACRGVRLCIIDSLSVSCGEDENSSAMGGILTRLAGVSERTGTVFLIIHHSRKPGQSEKGGDRHSIRGSSSIFNSCSAVFVMGGEKGEPVKVSCQKDRRQGSPSADFYLQIEDVTIDHNPRGGLRISQCEAPEENDDRIDESERFGKLRGAILAACRSTQLRSRNAIYARVKGRKTDVWQAIKELEEEGRLEFGGGFYHAK